jgi:hypothetical protein
MSVAARMLIPALSLSVIAGCADSGQANGEAEWSIDQRSYILGGIGAFAEMVGAGVKKLALSSPLDPVEMDAIIEEAERIAATNGTEVFRETDFLVTDLFSASLTDGKHVLLICHDSTRQEYMELKAMKHRLLESGQYDADARLDVARRMGELLSYSEAKIASLLAAEDMR